MDVPEPTMGYEFEGGKLYYTFICEVCFQKRKRRVKLRAGASITCPCGKTKLRLEKESIAILKRALKRGVVRGKVCFIVRPDDAKPEGPPE